MSPKRLATAIEGTGLRSLRLLGQTSHRRPYPTSPGMTADLSRRMILNTPRRRQTTRVGGRPGHSDSHRTRLPAALALLGIVRAAVAAHPQ